MGTPRIAALLPSYNRPRLLGQAVAMFEAQQFQDSELVILEDSGIFPHHITGKNWRLITSPCKFPTVGAKRNAMAGMTNAAYLAVMDDDDIYLPWWLAAMSHALNKYEWVRPTQILEWTAPGVVIRTYTYGARDRDCSYGGQWGYCRDAFLDGPRYPLIGNGDDGVFGHHMTKRYGPSGDTICPEYPDPFYVYQREQTQTWHAGRMGDGVQGILDIHAMPNRDVSEFKIELPEHYNIKIPTTVLPRIWK